MSNSKLVPSPVPASAALPTPRLLGPDYFKTKLVTSTSSDEAVADKQPLEQQSEHSMAAAMVIGPRIATSGGRDMHQMMALRGVGEMERRELLQRRSAAASSTSTTSRPQYLQLVGRKHSTSPSSRIRDTPVAEAAIKRERLSRGKMKSPAASFRLEHQAAWGKELASEVVKSKPRTTQPEVVRSPPVLPHFSTSRAVDEGGWTSWSLNDLDIDIQQPTTKPFVEYGMMSSPICTMTTTSTPIIENFVFQGESTRSTSIANPSTEQAQSIVEKKMQDAEGLGQSHSLDQGRVWEESKEITDDTLSVAIDGAMQIVSDDEMMAKILQKDEYSRELPEDVVKPSCEDYSYEMARRYQEEQDANTARELQDGQEQEQSKEREINNYGAHLQKKSIMYLELLFHRLQCVQFMIRYLAN